MKALNYFPYHCLALFTAASVTMMTGSARADQAGVAFDTTQYWVTSGGSGIYGWQFRTHADIQVSALGLYDNRNDGGFLGDGLVEPHTIAIWDIASPSNPLISTLIEVGAATSLMNGFQYVDVGSAILPANHDYAIAAVYPNGAFDFPFKDQTTGLLNNPDMVLTFGPGVEFGGYRFSATNVLQFPENFMAGEVYGFGPNFIYTVVPEPSPSVFLGIATLALIQMRGRVCAHSSRT